MAVSHQIVYSFPNENLFIFSVVIHIRVYFIDLERPWRSKSLCNIFVLQNFKHLQFAHSFEAEKKKNPTMLIIHYPENRSNISVTELFCMVHKSFFDSFVSN